MKTLEEAWRWYEQTKFLLRVTKRLADRHWDSIWDSDPCRIELLKDDKLNDLEGPRLVQSAGFGLAHLDDLAIVLLFSVFESIVREQVSAEVSQEIKGLKHSVILYAAEEARWALERGSFEKVLKSLKYTGHSLVEQVRQVRTYRNWVSHGRRGPPPFRLDPKAAYVRLSAFLNQLDQTTEDEQDQ